MILYRFNSSIFSSGVRPIIHGFVAMIHYPNQLLIAGNTKYQWPKKRPYLDITGDVPLCSTKEQMKKMFHHRGDYYGIDPPCREMKTIRTSYHESTFHIGDAPWVRKGTFWMGIIYPYEDFKEILQTRYYQRIRFRI